MVAFEGSEYDQQKQTTSFSYSLDDTSVNHFVIGLESCAEIRPSGSIPSTPLKIKVDPTTQISGLTWFGKANSYTVQLHGHVQKGPTTFGLVLGAYKSTTGVIDGPICSYYEDVVCNAGGPYYGECHNHALNIHLLGHNSLHATSYKWDHFIPGGLLLTPNNVASVLSLPTSLCVETFRISLTVVGHDPSDKRTCLAYIFIDDSTPPVIHNIYERDISADPHDIPAPMLLTAEDKCDPDVSIKFSEKRIDNGKPCSYKLLRTWIARDNCGNLASHTQIITVLDSTPPSLTGVGDDDSYACDVVPPPCTVEGNDYNEVTVEIKEFKTPGPCDCDYELTRKWIATDCAGNTMTDSQSIKVYDILPPIIYGAPEDTTVTCDEVPDVPTPTASDNCCGATVKFYDSKVGGDCPHEKTIYRSWVATDSCGNSATAKQTIVVEDKIAPTLSHVESDLDAECDEIPLPCEVDASDNCDDYTQLSFDETTVDGTCDHEYTIVYTWTVDDMCGNIESAVQRVHVSDGTPPVLTGIPPHSLTVECDALPTFTVKAKDNCDGSVVVTDTTNPISTLYQHDYVQELEWSATDQCGNNVVYLSTMTVQDLDDPVLIGVPDDTLVGCANIPEMAVVEATDNCCDTYVLEADESEDIVNGTCEHNYLRIRTWVVNDCSHNTRVATQTITVEDNQAPVLHGLPGFDLVRCDQIPPVAVVTATDDCDDDPKLTYTKVDMLGSCKTQYKELRTWTATDVCGNAVSYTQTVVTFDDHAPVFSGIPLDTTVECDFPYNTDSPEAVDNCDPYIGVVMKEDKKQGTCEYDKMYYRTWSAEDDCGNEVVASQTVTIQDIEPPTWSNPPDELITHEYPDEPEPPTLIATDNCEYEPEITFNEKKLQFGYLCHKAYRLVRAWFVVDRCGNMGPPLYQHVVIDDTVEPVIISSPEDATVECDDIKPPYPVTAIDHYEEIVVTMKETTNFGTCTNDYDIVRTWHAVDSCGNANSSTQVITVQDTEKPRFYNVPEDATAECLTPAAPVISAEDNCDGYIDVSLVSEDIEGGGTYAEGLPMRIVYRHWRVADNCGNANDAYQTIEVYDTKYPYFNDYNSDILSECDDIAPVPNIVSHDDCDPNPLSWYEFDSDDGTCPHAEILYRKWFVTDGVGHRTSFIQTVTVVDTTPPELKGYAANSMDVECDNVPEHGDLIATDNCDEFVDVTFTEVKVDPIFNCKEEYILFWTWTATDECGNGASYTKTVNVHDTVKPELQCNDTFCGEYEDVEVECDDAFLDWPMIITQIDNCDPLPPKVKDTHDTEHGTCEDAYLKIDTWVGEDHCGNKETYRRTVTVTDTTPPYWVETPDTTKRVPYDGLIQCPASELVANDNCDDNVEITCDPTIVPGHCPQEYTKTCKCKAVDNCGNSVEFVQVIEVFDNEPPRIPKIPDTTVECLSKVVAPSTPIVDWGYNTGTIGQTSRTIPDNCTYTIIYTWTATDECSLHDVVFQTVHVVDETPPVIHHVPEDETVQCLPPPTPGYLNGEDNCDGKVLVLFDKEKIDSYGPYCYTLVRTWSAADHCGRITIETQTIKIEDTLDPIISYPPTHVTHDCHTVFMASEDDVHVADNCELKKNVTFTEVKIPGTCECSYQLINTWRVCDSCHNCAQTNQTVTVVDNSSPVLSDYCIDITVQTDDVDVLAYESVVTSSDTYGAEVDTSYTETRINSTYAIGSDWVYILVRHYAAEDECGNSVEHTCTVTVIDTIPPTIIGVPKDVVLPCPPDNLFPTRYLTATITAAIEALITEADITLTVAKDVKEPGTCVNEYLWIRCWETEDHSLNTNTQCFTITVVDTEPPVFDGFPTVEFNECEPEGFIEGDVTATDNCPTGATVTVEEDDHIVGYSGFFVRVYTATDACGHTVNYHQTVWVSDTHPPVWDTTPTDETVYCADDLPDYNMTATDECHPDVEVDEVSWKEVICEGEYIVFYQWRATDSEGNWVAWSVQVQVVDGKAPVLYAGSFSAYDPNSSILIVHSDLHSSTSYQCPWVETHHPVYAKDECSEYPWDVPLYSVDRWGDYCGAFVAYHWQTSDDCGNEVDHSQTIEIVDTTPPELTNCPKETLTLLCGAQIPQPYVGAVDECEKGLKPVRSQELILGTCDYEYQVVVTWSVEDHCGFVDSCHQTVTYHDLENPVLTLHGDENVTQQCDETYDVPSVSASDDCQDYFNIEYDLTQVDGTCPCEYEFHRSWKVSDKCGSGHEVTQVVKVEDNESPVIVGRPKDITVPCLHEPPVPPMTATDNCCQVTLDYTQTKLSGQTCLFSYKLVRTWTASDECGHTSTYEYTVTVVDTESPEFTLGSFVPKFTKAECDAIPPQTDLAAYDICEGAIDVTPTFFTHSGDCLDAYFILRHWDASDDCGNKIHLEATVQVVDTTPPVVELPDADSYECDYIPNESNHNVEATDNCDPDPKVVFLSTILGADCSPNWSVMMMWTATDRCGNEAIYSMVVAIDDTFYPTLNGVPQDTTVDCHLPDVPHVTVDDDCDKLLTAQFTQEIAYNKCPYDYTAIRRWTAVDRCHNTVEESQRITIVDDGPPTLDGVPEDESMGCKDHFVAASVQANDNCQDDLVVSKEEETVPGSCPYQYVIIATWSTVDKCGNTVDESQTVTVYDNVPPEISEPPLYQSVPCNTIPPPPHMTAIDDCSYGVKVTYKQHREDGTCDNDYTLKRVWTAVDECGNKATVDCHVDVYDDEDPELVGTYAGDDTVECNDVPMAASFIAHDNCGGFVDYKSGEERINGSCPHAYRLVRWYSAEDICGNKVAKDYTITVEDNDDPEFVYLPPNITCECDEECEEAKVEATDSCGYGVTVDFDETDVVSSCPEERLLLRTWTITDECDLTDEYTQTVTVKDTTPPVIDGHEDLTADIGNIPAPWKCTWDDNCDDPGETDFTRRRQNGDCDHEFTYIYTCVVTDCVGNEASTTHAIHVSDKIAPVISGVGADITVEYSHVPLYEHALIGVAVSDNSDSAGDYADVLLQIAEDVIIPGYDANDYTIIRTWWAEDNCGNRAAVHQTIKVIDTTPPCFDEEPEDTSVECDAIPEPCEVFTVGEELHVDVYEGQTDTAYGAALIKRTWKACDHTGNCHEHTQSIVVEDTTPPVFTRVPYDTTLPCDCEAFPAIANLAAIDNCDEFVKVSHTETEANPECADTYDIVREWTAVDHAGEVTSAVQTIHIVDDQDPIIIGHPGDMTFDCHEVHDDNPKPWSHLDVYDNCDDDVELQFVLPAPKVDCIGFEEGCAVCKEYKYEAIDECGNDDDGKFTVTVKDDNGPVVYGGKHCIYNRSEDGYGSSQMYRTYALSDVITAEDGCDDNAVVSGVWFNRSITDRSNLLDGHEFRAVSQNIRTGPDCIKDQEYVSGEFPLPKGNLLQSIVLRNQLISNGTDYDEYSATIPTVVGKTYILNYAGRQSPCSPSTRGLGYSYHGLGFVTIYDQRTILKNGNFVTENRQIRRKIVSPYSKFFKWKDYDVMFVAKTEQTLIVFNTRTGIRFNVKDMIDYSGEDWKIDSEKSRRTKDWDNYSPMLVSYVGSGYWGESDTHHGEMLECDDEVDVTSSLADQCASLVVNERRNGAIDHGDRLLFVAIPRMSNDRFCYVSKTRSWRSITHYEFTASTREGTGSLTYWFMTDFAPENPSSYVWMDVNAEIEKYLEKGMSNYEVMKKLESTGAILSFWQEERGGPSKDRTLGQRKFRVTCEDLSLISRAQCQGRCYYKGYPTAIQYFTEDKISPGACVCARSCNGFGRSHTREYNLFKWFEGFFYSPDDDLVYILGHTETADLTINLWVEFSDYCGNEAIGHVEFWIAPSLEVAASQGRTCDETNTDLGEYLIPFAFTSDDVLAPIQEDIASQTDAAVEAALQNVMSGIGSHDGGGGDGGFTPLL